MGSTRMPRPHEPMPRNVPALDLLLARKASLLRLLQKQVGSRADAEDLLQTAMLRLVGKEGSLRDRDRLLPWFYRVLHNLVVDWHRRRAVAFGLAERLRATDVAGLDAPLFQEACTCVLDVLATLRAPYADILRRAELEGLTLVEAGRQLGITKRNAAVRLHRARRALLRGLHALCTACMDHGHTDCACKRTRRNGGSK